MNTSRADDVAAQRRQQIENMTPAEKKRLERQLRDFSALQPEEQQRIKHLHQEIEDSPDAAQLRRVMRAYCTWLESLPPHIRFQLADLKPAERLKRIQQLRAEEARRPKLEDREGLVRWIKDYASDRQHQAEILGRMSQESRESLHKFRGPHALNSALTWIVWQELLPRRPGWHGWPDPGLSDKPSWLTDKRLAELRECLSEETRKRLAKKSPVEQWEVISSWVELWGPGFPTQGPRGTPPSQELLERLSKFFESLPPEEQDELVNLPTDQMQRELQNKYFMSLDLMPGPDRWWEGGGPRGGRGRGDGGPPDLGPPPVSPQDVDGPGPPRGPDDGERKGPPPM